MIDTSGAMEASALLSTDTILLGRGSLVENSMLKADREIMTLGAYSLLYPKIHSDFPTRSEVGTFVYEQIQTAMALHHEKNSHWFLVFDGDGEKCAVFKDFTEQRSTIVELDPFGPLRIPVYFQLAIAVRMPQMPLSVSDALNEIMEVPDMGAIYETASGCPEPECAIVNPLIGT
jgi:hypothetical protein